MFTTRVNFTEMFVGMILELYANGKELRSSGGFSQKSWINIFGKNQIVP